MNDELENEIPITPESAGIDSALSILVADAARLNIDTSTDTLSTLAEIIAESLTGAELEPSLKGFLIRLRDLTCSILFELDDLQLTSMTELPLSELQTHLMTLSLGMPIETSIDVGLPTVGPPSALENLPEIPSLSLFSNFATEMWRGGHYFMELAKSPSDHSTDHWGRLVNIHFALTLEAECADRLASAILAFWPNRDKIVRGLLNSTSGKIALAANCTSVVTEIEGQHGSKLPGQRIPVGAVIGALRLILAKKDDSFQPTLLEAATLLLFLGRGEGNKLSLQGLSAGDFDELLVILLSIQKIKNDMVDCFLKAPVPDPSSVSAQVVSAVQWLSQLTIISPVEGGA